MSLANSDGQHELIGVVSFGSDCGKVSRRPVVDVYHETIVEVDRDIKEIWNNGHTRHSTH